MQNRIIIFLIFFNYNFFAQTDSLKYHNFVLKTDVVIPVVSIYSGGYGGMFCAEYNFLSRMGFQFSYLFQRIQTDKHKLINDQIIPDLKIYLFHKNKYKGLYSGIYFKNAQNYTKIKSSHDNIQYSLIEYKKKSNSIGVILGYQFYAYKKITIDFMIGVGARNVYNFNLIELENTTFSYNKNELDGRCQLLFGYRF